MPIRFHCSNGHLLQVGEELAGKRGACPECGEKVRVPAPTVAAQPTAPAPQAENAQQASPSAAPQAAKPVAKAVAKPKPVPPPAPEADPNAQWYLRSPSGEQFGPAASVVFQQWIREHRVTPESYIWRDGWPEWRTAGEAAAELPAPLLTPPPLPSSATESGVIMPPLEAQATEGPSAASRYAAKKKRAAKRRMYVAVALAFMTLALGGVLLWVLSPPAEEIDPLDEAAPLPTATVDEPQEPPGGDEPANPMQGDGESATMEDATGE